ncbi:hypothetical protein IDH44_15865 [Paenibacillus sp. IB182496]|uniref:Uncharacterized protein n=1 Tax=Paenibacillus sabuli TaxID=2772509 RepID=A0A927GT35_9BACL|nr:hypothetical protein [Paenibacillus sabuli]MBD2846675.1 hypothetical protein [Paenibacillus sabuli]
MSDKSNEKDASVSGADQQKEANREKTTALLKAVYQNGITALRQFFPEVAGKVLNQERFGPVFVFQVKDEEQRVCACGFFLQELVAHFQSGKDPAQWMASFYFDLMDQGEARPLPKPPAGEEETKALIDKTIVPHCIAAVREEFAPEQVRAGLGIVPKQGPVFEAGFPGIKDGNNVCAVPLHVMMTHHLLNRDPAELVIQGLHSIREQQAAKNVKMDSPKG